MNRNIITLLIYTFLLFLLVKGKKQSTASPEQIKRRQLANRDELHINFESSENYYFEIKKGMSIIPELQQTPFFNDVKQADFVINGIEGQDIKMIANAFWKANDTYVIPQIKEEQHVRLIIYENKTNILADKEFYIAEGVEIRTHNFTQYYIRFEAKGIRNKVIQLTIQKLIPEQAANKTEVESLEWVELKSGKILASFNVMLRILERNRIFSQSVANRIYELSKKFLGYQIFEAVILLIITVYQVKWIRKLTANDSII